MEYTYLGQQLQNDVWFSTCNSVMADGVIFTFVLSSGSRIGSMAAHFIAEKYPTARDISSLGFDSIFR